MTISEQIKKARKASGLTQAQLAEKAGISLMSVRRYESRDSIVMLEPLQKIAGALGVPLYDLVGKDEPDREYELICDTLHTAGYCMEPDVMADHYLIAPMEDPDAPEARREIKYSRLAEIVHKVLDDAEIKKKEYVQKRLEAELFGWSE